MKKIILSMSILFILASCSEESPTEENVESVSVSSIIRKNYSSSTNAVLSTHTTNVVNNKIQNITRTNPVNSELSITTYHYVNNKISLVETANNNILTNKSHYIYDSNDKIIEFRSESYNSQGQIQSTNKHTFNRIQGVIYTDWTRNSISSPTYTTVANSEMILDQNLNRTYFKQHYLPNNEIKKMETLYDANSNIVKEEQFLLDQNGNYTNILTNNYTYGTAINTLAFVNLQSMGKENMMLLYHLNSNAINEFHVKSCSPNVLNTFDTTFGAGQTTFSITNQANSNNYCLNSEYNTFNSNMLFGKFSYEYIFN